MRLLLLVVFLYAAPMFAQDVVINKYRNGGQNLIDTVEVLVVRDNFDLRGYILRDFATSSNSFNTDSISSGSYRFANTSFWQRVPAGTLLVLSLTNGIVQKLGDTVISVGLQNTAYFIETGRFDIAADDMVMIKRPGATISGTEGSVHAFCAGPIASANSTGIVPLVSTSQSANTAAPFALPNNLRGDTTDYNGNRAGTVAQARFGIANNPANQRFLDSLRRLRAPLTSVQYEKQLALTYVRIAPAPISNDCTVGFQMNASGTVEMSLVDMRGHTRQLTTAYHAAGEQSVRVSVGDVAQGAYFLVVKAGGGEWREKISVVR